MTLNPRARRRLAAALVLGSVVLAATAVAWFYLSGSRGSVQTVPSHQRKATSEEGKAALEAAVFRYETTIRQRTWNSHRSAQLRAVDCERFALLFRGKSAFRCAIRDQDPGIEARCYALVGRALYGVGGCFDPLRDMGAGKSRLLTRLSR